MRRYVGAMAASRDGTLISASAPRGGYVVHFSAETGRYVGRTEIAELERYCRVWREDGFGFQWRRAVIEAQADGNSREVASQPGIAFDNHLRAVEV